MDNRTSTVAQRKLQDMIDNSPGATQLKAVQQMVDQGVVQRAALVRDKLNIAGEQHPESDSRRPRERQVALAKTGSANYWREGEFAETSASTKPADPYELRYEQILQFALTLPIPKLAAIKKEEYLEKLIFADVGQITAIESAMEMFYADSLEECGQQIEMYGERTQRAMWLAGLRRVVLLHCGKVKTLVSETETASTTNDDGLIGVNYTKMEQLLRASKPLDKSLSEIAEGLGEMQKALVQANTDFNLASRDVSAERSAAMHAAGKARAGEKGVWKVGEKHADDMQAMDGRNYNLLSRDDFNAELG